MATAILDSCQLGDLPVGTRYLDNGGDEFIVTDFDTEIDSYSYVVNLTTGRKHLVNNGLKLRATRNRKLAVCPKLNGWVD